MFGATAESLSKASTMVFRIGTDDHLYDDPDDVSIAPLLDSKFDLEKREALKRLLALTAQGLDVSNFFTQVVKNVASQSLEVKKLVYLYLLHYAEKSLTFYDNVPTLVPMEEIASLEPGQTIRRILQVRFHHHILPLKLALFSDGKKLPVKLRPDIGYFVKPLPMDVESLHG